VGDIESYVFLTVSYRQPSSYFREFYWLELMEISLDIKNKVFIILYLPMYALYYKTIGLYRSHLGDIYINIYIYIYK
jgi:hypothetical protein